MYNKNHIIECEILNGLKYYQLSDEAIFFLLGKANQLCIQLHTLLLKSVRNIVIYAMKKIFPSIITLKTMTLVLTFINMIRTLVAEIKHMIIKS